MSKDYFGLDYFEADVDASLHFLLGQQQRKPSYDQLIPEELFCNEANLISNVTCESPKHRGLNLPSEEKQEKKVKKRREGTKILGEGRQRGHWKLEQNKRYHWFLELYCSHFLNSHMRRTDKIFKTMQQFVSTRQAEQCRSHHQKMEKKHGSFHKILKELRTAHYGSSDPEPLLLDMKANRVQSGDLLDQAVLESPVAEKSECLERERETINEGHASPLAETFLDPLLQFQCHGDQFLQGLIN